MLAKKKSLEQFSASSFSRQSTDFCCVTDGKVDSCTIFSGTRYFFHVLNFLFILGYNLCCDPLFHCCRLFL